MDIFNQIREMIKSQNRTLLRTGLELLSMLGHLLEGVVDIEVNSKSNQSKDDRPK